MKYKAGIVGAAGFAGVELVRYLVGHPAFDLTAITSDANSSSRLDEVYPSFTGKSDLSFVTNNAILDSDIDVAFLAVPHTASLAITPKLLERSVTVIDLSADFRLKDPEVYEKWYNVEHTEASLLQEAAFGLPEITMCELEQARSIHDGGKAVLVACAGCYPTATSLAAYPAIDSHLMKEGSLVVADAISGVTGAGKKATERTHFCFASENLEAYGVTSHRHTPEIEQILNIEDRLVFTPHLAPLNRGLLSTVTLQIDKAKLPKNADSDYFTDIYRKFYEGSQFVHVMPPGVQPKTSSVVGTNDAHVAVTYDPEKGVLVAVGAIDNLGKGAAGQAVQCANIVFGLDPAQGLVAPALPV